MEHEMIDKYNEIGEKLEIVDKSIAHRDGLWHKAVHVWIINDNNEILLQYRCAEKKLYPNMWDCSFAGHIGAGESSIEAVLREGKEELGIDVELEKLSLIMTNREEMQYEQINNKEFNDVFILRQNVDINKIEIQKEEVSDVKYIPIKNFFEYINSEKVVPHPIEYMVLKEILK